MTVLFKTFRFLYKCSLLKTCRKGQSCVCASLKANLLTIVITLSLYDDVHLNAVFLYEKDLGNVRIVLKKTPLLLAYLSFQQDDDAFMINIYGVET